EDHHLRQFITDSLRLMVTGNLDPHEFESLLDEELETFHQEIHEPSHAVQRMADSLPGFGIVAAVLGIVNTMASIAAPIPPPSAPRRLGAGRHVPGHPDLLRFRRPARRGPGA
ncbi:flagellar motor protein MotA, partial [mine drainage metagenome]